MKLSAGRQRAVTVRHGRGRGARSATCGHATRARYSFAPRMSPAGWTTRPEGALHRIDANRYQRDPRARKPCLDHWSYRCVVCDFSFEERYGPIGKNLIHVHHTLELSQVQADYCVSLSPTCARYARTVTP